jgi:hypothetical protein
MAEDRGRRTEDRRQMAEDRGQRTEVRGQRTENRWQTRRKVLHKKKRPFQGANPKDAIFGVVSIFYTILNIGSYSMMIWNLKFLLMRYLIPMYMTVNLMVIDTQDMRAVRKRAFPALRRSL